MRDDRTTKSNLDRRTLLRRGTVAASGLVAFGTATGAQSDETDQAVVTECTTITEPGAYVLGDDLETEDKSCLTIRASDVTLDGRGHTITRTGDRALPDPDRPDPDTVGIGTEAVDTDSLSGIAVTNVTVSNFGAGVHFDGVTDGYVGETTTRENNVGIYLENSRANTVAENTVVDTGWRGIALFDSDDNAVTENTTNDGNHDLSRGLELANSNRNTIDENEIADNYHGIELGHSVENRLERNTVRNNEDTNILLNESDSNALLGNTVATAGWVGISVSGADNELESNTVSDTRGYGFTVTGVENLIRGNEITGSAAYGLSIDGERGLVEENTVAENDLAGIRISGRDHALNDNVSSHNGEAELFLVEDSSDNTGAGNLLTDDVCADFVDEGTNNRVEYAIE